MLENTYDFSILTVTDVGSTAQSEICRLQFEYSTTD